MGQKIDNSGKRHRPKQTEPSKTHQQMKVKPSPPTSGPCGLSIISRTVLAERKKSIAFHDAETPYKTPHQMRTALESLYDLAKREHLNVLDYSIEQLKREIDEIIDHYSSDGLGIVIHRRERLANALSKSEEERATRILEGVAIEYSDRP